MKSGGKKRSSVHRMNLVGTSGHALSGHGLCPGASDWSHHDHIIPVAHRVDNGTGVLGQSGGIVVTWQIGRLRFVSSRPQLPLHQVPVPADIPGAVNHRESRHPLHLPALAHLNPVSDREGSGRAVS